MKSDIIHQYYYLWSVALVIPIWLLVFIKKKRSRTETVYMGLLLGTSALALDRFCSFYDYWRPPTLIESFNFESFLYGFFWGGIAAKCYELVFNRETVSRRQPAPLPVVGIVVGSVFLYVVLGLSGFNSVDSYVGLMFFWVVVLVCIRPRLIWISILSGLLMTALNILCYAVILSIYPHAVEKIWLASRLSGISLFHVPIEEHLYIFALGCFGSILFKAVPPAKPGTRPVADRPTQSGIVDRVKPYGLPLALFVLVIGRMLIFGKARIPVGQIFHDLALRLGFMP